MQERIARRQKLARKKRSTIALMLVGLLALGAVLFFAVRWIVAKQVPPMSFAFSQEKTAAESADELLVYTQDYGVGIRYPETGKKELDTAIQNDAKQLQNDLVGELSDYHAESAEKRASMTVNFKAYQVGSSALSVVYDILKNDPARGEQSTSIKTYVYQIKSARAVTAKELFKDEYLALAADYVKLSLSAESEFKDKMATEQFAEHIAPKWENFSAVSFEDEENLTLYFDRGTLFSELARVKIPLARVYDAMQMNLTGYEPPKSRVDPTKPMVALTFDDGPYSPVTTRILDALEKVGGRATFFVLGERAAETKSQEVLKRAAEMGCQIGNHSYDHANLAKLDADKITEQIQKTSAMVQQATGQPTSLARAPYGAINALVRNTVGVPLVNWSIDTLDWKTKNPDKIIPEVLNHIHDGDVVLMHDIYKTSAASAEVVIPELVRRGYQLVTISELMEARQVVMVAGKTYSQAYKKTK